MGKDKKFSSFVENIKYSGLNDSQGFGNFKLLWSESEFPEFENAQQNDLLVLLIFHSEFSDFDTTFTK